VTTPNEGGIEGNCKKGKIKEKENKRGKEKERKQEK
jgi:hypothetical protein